jgi:hypothetical protein
MLFANVLSIIRGKYINSLKIIFYDVPYIFQLECHTLIHFDKLLLVGF